MRKILLLFFLNSLAALLFGQSADGWRAKIAPELLASLDRGERVDLLLIFTEQADLHEAQHLKTKSERAHFVYARLRETAARSQQNATRILRDNQAFANSLFLVNAIAVEKADAALARELATLPEVKSISPDPWVHFDGPVQTEDSEAVGERDVAEWGLVKINAPDVWALGYTGQGITVGGADTGYEWVHPAIQKKYRGWAGDVATTDHNYNWHDAIHDYSPMNLDSFGNPIGTNPCGFNSPAPCDDSNHGTHTMGTMTGNDGFGNLIGVAPDARWVGCRNMERGDGRPSTYLECFQWFLAPTDLNNHDPDPEKAPHVINNSWYCSVEEGCTDMAVDQLLRTAVINLRASGIVVVVSNGNAGPWCGTTFGPPAYFEESFSVGATRQDNFIADFSSRGPVLVDGSFRMKPNVSAPGHNIRSCIRNGNYANFNGTSMAGPHVAGLIALVLSARPELAGHVEDIETIVEQTSVYYADTLDCGSSSGSARPNHAYGWGRVDALGALHQALLWEAPVGTESPVLPIASIFPNPVGNEAIFDFQHLSGKTGLEIFSPEGKLVFSKNWTAQNRESVRVSLQGQAAGIYFWQLRTEHGVISGKLVRE